jgi:hypothetical protein
MKLFSWESSEKWGLVVPRSSVLPISRKCRLFEAICNMKEGLKMARAGFMVALPQEWVADSLLAI